MSVLYTNNATSVLLNSVSSLDTTVVLSSGTGSLFPSINVVGDFFYCTITDSSGNMEIVKATARTNDSLTVIRAQEGTSALGWNAGDRVELRITKGLLDQLKLDATKDTASNLSAHTSNTSNPHSVTATQVGLGNVTNESKATMFTSPTFTGNAVLGTPASGDFSTGTFTWPTFNQNTSGNAATATYATSAGDAGTLDSHDSTYFATASDLSSHTGNTSNPHSVTQTQVGLSNVENKSSATIRSEITSGNVTTALGFTPENVSNKSTSVSTDGSSDTKYPSVKAVKDYADGLVVGLLDYRGAYDASGNVFPSTGGSGSGGAVLKGDMWIISVAGTLGGVAIHVGDSVIAATDSPGQTAGNWNTLNGNVSYVPANAATTISTSAPLSGGGDLSTNRTLSISQSTTSTNGYLSSTDWNTFNGKASTSGTLGQFAATTSSQLAGVISDETGSGSLVFNTSPTLSGVTLSDGTANGVLYLNGSKQVTSGSGLVFDSSGNLGIGTSSPSAKLDVDSGVAGQASHGLRVKHAANSGYSLIDASSAYGDGGGGDLLKISNYGGVKLALNNSGNLGIGVTPSGWSSAYRTMEYGVSGGNYGVVWGSSNGDGGANWYGQIGIGNNLSAGDRYAGNGAASFYLQSGGRHTWYNAPSGTAGNAITWSEKMRLDSSGNLGLGTSSPSYRFDVFSSGTLGSVVDVARFYAESGSTAESRILFGTAANVVNAAIGAVTTTATDGVLKFYTEGSGTLAERMRIDSSGNLGIGATGNLSKLTVNSGNNNSAISYVVFNTQDTNKNGLLISNWTGSATSYGPRIGFDNSGRGSFLIGGSDGANNFDICRTWGTPDVRIDSSGNLLVGATSETFNSVAGGGTYALGVRNLQKNNSVLLLGGTSDSTAQYKIVFANGDTAVGSVYTNGTTTSYNTSSDYRLKEDYQPVADAIVRLNQLKPINFAWKVDGSRCDGFLAHELQEVIPEAATGTKDETRTEEYEVTPAVKDEEGNVITEAVVGEREVPVYQGIDQSKIVPLLTAALQEAVAKIESLTQRIEALEYTKQGE